jgi:hypothetical protein
MSKTFYAKTAQMGSDMIDDLILDAAELHDLNLSQIEITDKLRQSYVDITHDSDFILNAISSGEDYYARNVNKRVAREIIRQLGK